MAPRKLRKLVENSGWHQGQGLLAQLLDKDPDFVRNLHEFAFVLVAVSGCGLNISSRSWSSGTTNSVQTVGSTACPVSHPILSGQHTVRHHTAMPHAQSPAIMHEQPYQQTWCDSSSTLAEKAWCMPALLHALMQPPST
jgi:hypothetical protein